MKSQLYQILSYCAIVASFIPILLVAVKNLWREKAFMFIGFYWMLSGLINCLDLIPGISNATLELIIVVYNMFDIPIVLGIIGYATKSRLLGKIIRVAAPALLLLQLLNFFRQGWNYDAAKYILALGLVMVLFAVLWEISRYMQQIEHNRHEKAMIFIHVSFLFSYGTFIIVYIFDYYVNLAGSGMENLIIYYISILVAVFIASIGYLTKCSNRNFI